MPAPPSKSLLTQYVLENPWPLAIVLLIAAAYFAWSGFREGIATRQKVAGVLALFAGVVLLIGHFVVTAGEHARDTTMALVKATMAKDLIATSNLLTDNAVVSFGKPTNPGFDRDFIMERLDAFRRQFTIDSNSASVNAYGESSNAAIVHLECTSQVTTSQYALPAISKWVLRVEKQPTGEWKIARVTLVSVNNEPQDGRF